MRDRLASEVDATPSLEELAQIAGVSKYQVLRAFKKRHGLPPHAWLLSLRAERARGFIRDGASLATAAARAGFADQSHMTRTFRRYYGYTPGAWQLATLPVIPREARDPTDAGTATTDLRPRLLAAGLGISLASPSGRVR